MAYTEGMMPCWKSRRGITSTESFNGLETLPRSHRDPQDKLKWYHHSLASNLLIL